MLIKFVEIANFRKLLSVRVDFAEKQTLFVGANNSGKSSAMLGLRRFLVPKRCAFEIHDLTLCHWPEIDRIGQSWIDAHNANETVELSIDPWLPLLPTLDLWLDVDAGEMHHVRDLIPTLDWEGGTLGVRLRYEPTKLEDLFKDFIAAVNDVEALRAAAAQAHAEKVAVEGADTPQSKLTLWPATLVDYLSRRLSKNFTIRAYTLDPAKLQPPPKGGQALPHSHELSGTRQKLYHATRNRGQPRPSLADADRTSRLVDSHYHRSRQPGGRNDQRCPARPRRGAKHQQRHVTPVGADVKRCGCAMGSNGRRANVGREVSCQEQPPQSSLQAAQKSHDRLRNPPRSGVVFRYALWAGSA